MDNYRGKLIVCVVSVATSACWVLWSSQANVVTVRDQETGPVWAEMPTQTLTAEVEQSLPISGLHAMQSADRSTIDTASSKTVMQDLTLNHEAPPISDGLGWSGIPATGTAKFVRNTFANEADSTVPPAAAPHAIEIAKAEPTVASKDIPPQDSSVLDSSLILMPARPPVEFPAMDDRQKSTEPQLHPSANQVDQNNTSDVQRFNQHRDVGESSTPDMLAIPPAIFQQFTKKIEYGRTLARRGAIYAARDEFIAALRLITETFDQQAGSRQFSVALLEGLTAMDEADDFMQRGELEQIILDHSSIARNHRTKIIFLDEWARITPQQAMQRYYEYAEQRFVFAFRGHTATAIAFHSLGKSYALPARLEGNSKVMNLPKSMIMFRVAATIDPWDYQSRNELAVLMAGNGRYHEAKQHLIASLQIKRSPAAWFNLNKVHHLMGERELADLAMAEYVIAQNNQRMADATSVVRWVSPQQMNDLAPPPEQEIAPHTQMAEQPPASDGNAAKSGWFNSFKSWF